MVAQRCEHTKIIDLYTLNVNFVICELYLKKTVKREVNMALDSSCDNFTEENIWGYKENGYMRALIR